MTRQVISVIIPVYNEEANIPLIYKAIKKVVTPLEFNFEFIFVNDGSQDGSLQALETLSRKDKRVKVIDFARNFGKEMAITAGLHEAVGDAALIIDADLQHPVELIPEFIAKWEDGIDVVIGVRESYGKEPFLKKFYSALFYKLFNAITETKTVPHATDYRLIDRAVIDAFKQFKEQNRIARGLIDWLGYRREYIYFTASERINGLPTYSFLKLARLALDTLVGHTLLPLRLAGWIGIFITGLASTAMAFILIERFGMHDPWNLRISGTAMLADFNMILIGIVLMSLGLISLYVANIHDQTIARPLYAIRRPRQHRSVSKK